MSNPFQALMGSIIIISIYSLLAQSLIIKQKVEWADVLVGYDQANQYAVYIPNKNGGIDRSANPIYRVLILRVSISL